MTRVAHLLIAMTMLLAIQPAQAQGMEAGSMQSMTPSSTIGPDQDSLLPPEVVPLDPSTMNALSQSRQAGIPQDAYVPGLAQNAQNPQDMRRQAFDQLYGGQSTMPANAAQQIWNQAPQAQPGMTPGMTPGMMGAQGGAPNFNMAQNPVQEQQGYIAQSQTLTGGSNNQPSSVNTRRGGFTNRLNFGSSLGMGLLSISRNPLAGAAMLGTTMSGLGSFRNSSR